MSYKSYRLRATSSRKKTMAQIDVVNLNGEKVGSLDLADAVFGQVNEALLWEAVYSELLPGERGRPCGYRQALHRGKE